MRALFEGWTPLVLLVVIVLLFGAPKLPALARSIGQSMKILKSEVREDNSKTASSSEQSANDDSAK